MGSPFLTAESTRRLIELLRALFRADASDLDHGIFRLLNRRRYFLDKFIEQDVPEIVETAMSQFASEQAQSAAALVERKAREVRAALGREALLEDGSIAESFAKTPVAREYAALREEASAALIAEAAADEVVSLLHSFFSRYYSAGDFIAQPRFGSSPAYWVPHSGTDVALHWVTRDQYFVRSFERVGTFRVRLKHSMLECAVVKSSFDTDKMKLNVLCLMPGESVTWDGHTLRCQFEYRPMSEAEAGDTDGETRQNQDWFTRDAAMKVGKRLRDAAPKAVSAELLAQDLYGQTILHRHLSRFVARPDTDFFIHRNLKEFLNRELDVFLKTQVLVTGELLAEAREVRDHQLLVARTVQAVARPLIDFVGQIEDFQRRMFERRKFVLKTEYCITLDRVPRQLWPAILANKKQVEEWRALYGLDQKLKSGRGRQKLDEAFLESQPRLVVDTRHYDEAFKAELLAVFDDLDAALDGTLVNGDNFQALALLHPVFKGRVSCIYIDPPFNTENDQFLYKDRFRDSTWLTMMENRIAIAKDYLADYGSIYVHLDLNSNYLGRFLLNEYFTDAGLINEVIWRIGWVSGFKVTGERFVRNHETIFVYGRGTGPHYFDKAAAQIPYEQHLVDSVSEQLNAAARKWKVPKGSDPGRVTFFGPDETVYKIGLEQKKGRYNVEDTWNSSEYERLDSNKIKRNAAEYTPNGSRLTQKPEALLRRVLTVSSREGDVVLDFFAGSGTTPAVAQKLGRKFLAIETGSYFDSDVVWRMKKVLSGHKVGISNRSSYQGGGFFKCIWLERYEDTFDNVRFSEVLDSAVAEFGRDFLVTDLFRFDAAGSPGMPSTDLFSRPFNYALRTSDSPDAPVNADLIETFNYLRGCRVKRRRAYTREGRRYVALRAEDGRDSLLIVWRSTDDLGQADLADDAAFIEGQVIHDLYGTAMPTRILVNSPCAVLRPRPAEALELEFVRLMSSPLDA